MNKDSTFIKPKSLTAHFSNVPIVMHGSSKDLKNQKVTKKQASMPSGIVSKAFDDSGNNEKMAGLQKYLDAASVRVQNDSDPKQKACTMHPIDQVLQEFVQQRQLATSSVAKMGLNGPVKKPKLQEFIKCYEQEIRVDALAQEQMQAQKDRANELYNRGLHQKGLPVSHSNNQLSINTSESKKTSENQLLLSQTQCSSTRYSNMPTQSEYHSQTKQSLANEDSFMADMDSDDDMCPTKLYKANQLVSFYPKVVQKMLARKHKTLSEVNRFTQRLTANLVCRTKNKSKAVSKMHDLNICQTNFMKMLLSKIDRRSRPIKKHEKSLTARLQGRSIYLDQENFDITAILQQSSSSQSNEDNKKSRHVKSSKLPKDCRLPLNYKKHASKNKQCYSNESLSENDLRDNSLSPMQSDIGSGFNSPTKKDKLNLKNEVQNARAKQSKDNLGAQQMQQLKNLEFIQSLNVSKDNINGQRQKEAEEMVKEAFCSSKIGDTIFKSSNKASSQRQAVADLDQATQHFQAQDSNQIKSEISIINSISKAQSCIINRNHQNSDKIAQKANQEQKIGQFGGQIVELDATIENAQSKSGHQYNQNGSLAKDKSQQDSSVQCSEGLQSMNQVSNQENQNVYLPDIKVHNICQQQVQAAQNQVIYNGQNPMVVPEIQKPGFEDLFLNHSRAQDMEDYSSLQRTESEVLPETMLFNPMDLRADNLQMRRAHTINEDRLCRDATPINLDRSTPGNKEEGEFNSFFPGARDLTKTNQAVKPIYPMMDRSPLVADFTQAPQMGMLGGITADFTGENHCLMEVDLPENNNDKEYSLSGCQATKDHQCLFTEQYPIVVRQEILRNSPCEDFLNNKSPSYLLQEPQSQSNWFFQADALPYHPDQVNNFSGMGFN